jgi:formylglycine-generating enzyme required for sulfatase activity
MVPVPPDDPAFHMARTLVTNRQFAQFLADDGNADWLPGCRLARELADRDYLRHWTGGEFPEALSEHPVVCVSAFAAQAFADWAAARWQVPLRLPRRHEWETAARAGRPTPDFATADVADGIVSYRETDAALTAVDELGSNPYHIGDLLGNACDLCLVDGAEGVAAGVLKCGGSYWTPRHLLTSCSRLRPDECREDVGFRCVQTLAGPERIEVAPG